MSYYDHSLDCCIKALAYHDTECAHCPIIGHRPLRLCAWFEPVDFEMLSV